MAQGRITKRSVEGIALPPVGKRAHLWDDTLKGFGVMVTPNGVRSYVVQYRMGGRESTTKTMTLGHHGSPLTADIARSAAADALEKVRCGVDPKAERELVRKRESQADLLHRELAFSAYSEQFLVRHADGRLKTAKDIRSVFRRDLIPFFGEQSLALIVRSDVTRCLDHVSKRSGSAANKAHKWLHKMFNSAVDRGDITASPMLRMSKPHVERQRERFLSDQEIAAFWIACDTIGYPFGPMTQLLLLTGQRLREVAKMRWSEIDLPAAEWALPGTRTKNNVTNICPLNTLAVDLLSRIARDHREESPFIFTTNQLTPVSGFSKAKLSIDAHMAKELGSESYFEAPELGWVMHDLRRTLATGCQALGIPIDHTEALINHTGKQSGLVGIYQVHTYKAEKAAAMKKWGDRVGQIIARSDSDREP